jgi:hypothetical protein
MSLGFELAQKITEASRKTAAKAALQQVAEAAETSWTTTARAACQTAEEITKSATGRLRLTIRTRL